MSKIDTVRAAMMQAMKDKDKERKDALSLLLSALKSKQIDKRADLTEEEENAVIFREIKQAQETIDTTPADRVQTIEEAKLRMQVYGEFVPKLMDEDEIRAVIKEVLAELQIEQPTVKDKGRIMKTLMPRVKGKADGGSGESGAGQLLRVTNFEIKKPRVRDPETGSHARLLCTFRIKRKEAPRQSRRNARGGSRLQIHRRRPAQERFIRLIGQNPVG